MNKFAFDVSQRVMEKIGMIKVMEKTAIIKTRRLRGGVIPDGLPKLGAVDLQSKLERKLRESNIAKTRRIKDIKEDDMEKELKKLSGLVREDAEKLANEKLAMIKGVNLAQPTATVQDNLINSIARWLSGSNAGMANAPFVGEVMSGRLSKGLAGTPLIETGGRLNL